MLIWIGDIFFTIFAAGTVYRLLLTPGRVAFAHHGLLRGRREFVLIVFAITLQTFVALAILGLAYRFLGVPRWIGLIGL